MLTQKAMPKLKKPKQNKGEFAAVILIGVAQIATVALCLAFQFDAFDTSISCPNILFEDDGLLLAQFTGLVLTTPWNIERSLTTSFVFIVSAVLFLTFATSILIAENSLVYLQDCNDTSGKRGAYTCVLWINLFCFVHTAILWGYRIYSL